MGLGLKKLIRLINRWIQFDSLIKWIEYEFEDINSFIRLIKIPENVYINTYYQRIIIMASK